MQYWFTLISKSLGSRLYIGTFWAFITALSGVALLMLSGWFITATALTGIAISAGIVIMFDMYMPGSGIRFFALSRTIGRYVERIYNHDSILRLISVFRLRLFKGLSTLPLSQLRATSDSEWLARLTADLDALDSLLLRYIVPPIVALLLCLTLTIFLSFFWLEMALYLGGFMLLCLVVTVRVSIRYTKEFAGHSARLQNDTRGNIIEHLQGAFELQSYGLMQEHENKVTVSLRSLYKAQSLLNERIATIQLLLDLLIGMALMTLICIGLYGVNLQLIDGPVAVMLVMMFMGVSEILQSLPSQFSTWGKTHFSAARLVDLMGPKMPANNIAINELNTIDCRLENHPKVSASLEKPIHFTLAKHQLINIQGRSGSGKSTIANMLAGLEKSELTSRVIVNNSVNLCDISSAQWFQKIAYLEQSNSILAGTLGYNLALGIDNINEEDIWAVLKLVELHEWAASLPKGLHSWLGETGSKISGGQGRRICLARLLLRNPQLVILDEPFNGIDDNMAARIWDNIQPVISSKMTVLLSHERPAYLKDEDSVIEL